MTLYPGVALGIAAIILYFFYGLTDDKFKQIAEDLNNANGNMAPLNNLGK